MHGSKNGAAQIAVRTAKEFVSQHSGELDEIKWVLFDDHTLKAYSDEISRQTGSE